MRDGGDRKFFLWREGRRREEGGFGRVTRELVVFSLTLLMFYTTPN
jgi:hypothetical protein